MVKAAERAVAQRPTDSGCKENGSENDSSSLSAVSSSRYKGLEDEWRKEKGDSVERGDSEAMGVRLRSQNSSK